MCLQEFISCERWLLLGGDASNPDSEALEQGVNQGGEG